MPGSEIALQWDGYINIPKCPYNKAMKFIVQSSSEIEMWIDDRKIMDATGRQRMHSPGYWEGYVPLAPGFHALRLRLSGKKGQAIELALLYSPFGDKISVPAEALFHAGEDESVSMAESRTPQPTACAQSTPIDTINIEEKTSQTLQEE